MTSDHTKLYPDIDRLGGLPNALIAALREINSPLCDAATHLKVPFAFATIKYGSRSSQISIAVHERLFLFDFWARGVCLATAQTPSLTDTARAIHHWLTLSITSSDLALAFPFVTPHHDAPIYEQGREVESRWQRLLQNDRKEITPFITAAYAQPKLRQLFPYTSHYAVGFSRCTGYPFSRDIPFALPIDNSLDSSPGALPSDTPRYQVRTVDDTLIRICTAEEAAALIVSLLPPNCGPAVPGTAEDL